MLGNYFVITFRNLKKNRLFSLINISGLAIGLAVFLLIMLWIEIELSFNNFHEGRDRIAAMMVNKKTGNDISSFPAVPSLLAKSMAANLPEIENAARTSWGDVRLLSKDEKKFTEYGLYVDPQFLKIFTFPLVNGNSNSVLKNPNTILLSETLAKKYFGDENAVGKQIMVEQSTPYTVEGVFKDVPSNATLRFDYLMPIQDYITQYMGGRENWSSNNLRTYIKVKPGVNRAALDKGLKTFMQKFTDEQADTELFLWNLEDWYLRFDFKDGKYAGGGRIANVKLFSLIRAIHSYSCLYQFHEPLNCQRNNTVKGSRRTKSIRSR
jgi:hypothetical protein